MSHSGDKFETKAIAEEFDESKSDGLPKRVPIFRRYRHPSPSSTIPELSHSSLFSIKDPSPPPKPSIHDAVLTPEASAGFFDRLWFIWVTPLLSLGYARPLEASDLYRLRDEHSSTRIASTILASFDHRRKQAAVYNERLANGQVGPGIKGLWWSIRGIRAEREKAWRERDGKRKASLILAMNDSVKWHFWSAGILKVIGDTAQVTSPLVVKV